MMKLRYVGSNTITFVEVGELHPSDEFHVEDERASGFLTRADVERVIETVEKPARTRKQITEPEPLVE